MHIIEYNETVNSFYGWPRSMHNTTSFKHVDLTNILVISKMGRKNCNKKSVLMFMLVSNIVNAYGLIDIYKATHTYAEVFT